MARKKLTSENTKDCKMIAGCNALAISQKSPARRKIRTKGVGRDQLAYWKKALRVESKSGKFFVQIYYAGERGSFTFEKNAEAAAEKARQIFFLIRKEGWQAARDRYSPRAANTLRIKKEAARVEALGGKIENPTIGDLIRVAAEVASHCRPSTFHTYCKAIRFLASEIFQVPDTEEISIRPQKRGKRKPPMIRVKNLKKDYRGSGLERWRSVVDAFPLADLTTERVEKWRREYLSRATDPVAHNHAKVSFNKTIRCAKALFSKKKGKGFLPKLEPRLALPNPLPLSNVPLEDEPPATYRSKIDPSQILKAALSELLPSRPELFKALILTLVVGLRRSEADTLLWRHVDFQRAELLIEPTEYYGLKSGHTAGVLALDPQTLAFFREWKEKAPKGAIFVMESPLIRKPNARTPSWRCLKTFTPLIAWLRAKGVTYQKPIHTLRKEAGTILIRQGKGIEFVSKYLRHSDIAITLKYYADLTQNRTSIDLGSLLTP